MTGRHEVDIVTVPERTLAVRRFHVEATELAGMGALMGGAFGAVMAALHQLGVPTAGPAVAVYERSNGGFDVAAGFPIAAAIPSSRDVAVLELPATEVAHTCHMGSYEDLPSAYEALRLGAAGRGRRLDESGRMWEEYLSGPDAPPERTRTEVYWPLAA